MRTVGQQKRSSQVCSVVFAFIWFFLPCFAQGQGIIEWSSVSIEYGRLQRVYPIGSNGDSLWSIMDRESSLFSKQEVVLRLQTAGKTSIPQLFEVFPAMGKGGRQSVVSAFVGNGPFVICRNGMAGGKSGLRLVVFRCGAKPGVLQEDVLVEDAQLAEDVQVYAGYGNDGFWLGWLVREQESLVLELRSWNWSLQTVSVSRCMLNASAARTEVLRIAPGSSGEASVLLKEVYNESGGLMGRERNAYSVCSVRLGKATLQSLQFATRSIKTIDLVCAHGSWFVAGLWSRSFARDAQVNGAFVWDLGTSNVEATMGDEQPGGADDYASPEASRQTLDANGLSFVYPRMLALLGTPDSSLLLLAEEQWQETICRPIGMGYRYRATQDCNEYFHRDNLWIIKLNRSGTVQWQSMVRKGQITIDDRAHFSSAGWWADSVGLHLLWNDEPRNLKRNLQTRPFPWSELRNSALVEALVSWNRGDVSLKSWGPTFQDQVYLRPNQTTFSPRGMWLWGERNDQVWFGFKRLQ
jgi:hypothetical protein